MKNLNIKDKMIPFFTLSALTIALTACGGGGGGGGSNNPGGNNNPPLSQGDADNDGLSVEEETSGWKILVDENGWGMALTEQLVEYSVTSDPGVFDTDSDGLSDQEERAASTNPRRADTDGDGLSDYDELNTYGSSPVSKDTDGDARDVRIVAGNAVHFGQPNANLFDGAEVDNFMSPLEDDTDGDGLSDFREFQGSGASAALVANVPDIRIDVYSNPVVSIEANYTDTEDNTQEFGETFSQGSSTASTSSRTNTLSSSEVIENSHTEDVSVSVSYPWGASFDASYSQTETTTSSSGMESTSYYDETRAEEMAQAHSSLASQAKGKVINYEGGSIEITFDITNEGSLPVSLSGVEISATQLAGDNSGEFEPVGLLQPHGSGAWSLGQGDTSIGNIASASFTSSHTIEKLFTNLKGFQFKVSNYTMKDAETETDYVVQYSEVAKRTGTLVLDYGDYGPVVRYQLATNSRRDSETNKPTGITLAEALSPKMLNLPYEVIRSDETGLEVLTSLGLNSFGDSVGIGSDVSDGFWIVVGEDTNKDFSEIVLNQGKQVSLLFVRDEDQDGLLAREERLLGTDDLEEDTDGDGLTDYEEVRQGWLVYGQKVYSDPRLSDSDNDGMTDLEELAYCDGGVNPGCDVNTEGANPMDADTDGDGRSDASDPEILITHDNTVPTQDITIEQQTNAGKNRNEITLNGLIQDNDGTVEEVFINWGDGNNETLYPSRSAVNLDVKHFYESTGTFDVEITATDDDGESSNFSARVDVHILAEPIVHLNFNENVLDQKGHVFQRSNHPTYVPDHRGRSRQAADFYHENNSSDGVLLSTENLGLTEDHSIAMWVFIANDIEERIAGTPGGYQFYLSSGKLRFGYGTGYLDSSSERGVSLNADVDMETWYFVVGVKEGDTLKLYMDGELFGEVEDSRTLSTECRFYLGTFPGDNGCTGTESDEFSNPPVYFSDVKVFDYALNIGEINNLYNQ